VPTSSGANFLGLGNIEITGGAFFTVNSDMTINNDLSLMTTPPTGINGTADLTLNGAFNWDSGNITGSGTEKIITNGTTTLDTSAPIFMTDRIWDNNGTIEWNDGIISLTNATINNLSSGLFNVNVAIAGSNGIDNIGTIVNDGTIDIKPGSGVVNFNVDTVNNGTLNITDSTLDFSFLSESFDNNGNLDIASGAKLLVSSGIHNFNVGTNLTGAGEIELTGGDLNVNSNSTVTDFTHSGGTLGGSGSLTVTNTWTPTSGVTLDGNLILDSGVLTSLGGTTAVTINGTGSLVNKGTLILQKDTLNVSVDNDGGFLQVLGSDGIDSTIAGAFQNRNGATLELLGGSIANEQAWLFLTGGSFTNDPTSMINLVGGSGSNTNARITLPTGILTNDGTITSTSSATAQSNSLQATVDNNGLVDLDAHNLTMNLGGTHTGAFDLVAGTQLFMSGGTHDLNPGTSFVGSGRLVLGGDGSINVNTNLAVDEFMHTTLTGALGGSAALTVNNTWFVGSGVVVNTDLILGPALTRTMTSLVLNGTGTLISQGSLTLNGSTLHTDFISEGTTLVTGVTTTLAGAASQTGGTLTVSGGAVLNAANYDLSGGVLELQSGTFNAAGTTNISGGATLQLTGGAFSPTGALNNNGVLDLDVGSLSLGFGGTHTGDFDIAAGTTLQFTGGAHNFNSGSDTFGAGNVSFTGGTETYNAGSTYAIAGASLFNGGNVTFNIPLNNTGLFDIDSGVLSLSNGGTHTGDFDVAAGSVLQFTGGTHSFNAGSDTFGAGDVAFTGGTSTYNAGSTYAISGDTGISGGVSPTVVYHIDAATNTFTHDAGNYGAGSTGTLTTNGWTPTPSAQLTDLKLILSAISNNSLNLGAPISLFGTATIENQGTLSLANMPFIYGGTGSFINKGPLTLDTVSLNTLPFINSHDLIITGAGISDSTGPFNMSGGTIDVQSGTLSLTGGVTIDGINSFNNNGGTFNVSGLTLNAGSVLDLAGGAITGGILSNTTINAGSQMTISSGLYQAGGVTNVDGTLLLSGGDFASTFTPTLNINSGGLLQGTGNITSNVNVMSGGTLTPGASPGLLTITGNYTQSPGAILNVELGGTNQGVDYDWLNVLGTATLDGALNTSLFGGFTPTAGDLFDVISAAAIAGDFATINQPAGFTASPLATQYQLSYSAAAPPPPPPPPPVTPPPAAPEPVVETKPTQPADVIDPSQPPETGVFVFEVAPNAPEEKPKTLVCS